MASQWYYMKGPVEFGPLSSQELRDRVKSGEIEATDLIRKAGMQKWTPAQKVKGLFANQQTAVAATKAVPSPKSPSARGIDFSCPHCRHQMTVPSTAAGKRGRCPSCQKVIEIARTGGAADAAGRSRMTSAVIPKKIKFVCPHCQHTMNVQEQFAGRQGKCPSCSEVVMIVATTKSSRPRPLPEQPPPLPTAIPDVPRVSPPVQKSDAVVAQDWGGFVQVQTGPAVVPPSLQADQSQVAPHAALRGRHSTSAKGYDAELLLRMRQEAYAELMDHQPLEYKAVKRKWKWMGVLGSHRSYLGQNVRAMLMALTLGGYFVWWILDRTRLKKMTDAWNADQLKRQQTNKPPRDSDGLVLVDPVELQKPAPWKDKPPPLAEKVIMLIYTLPTQILQVPAKLLMQKSDRARKSSGFQKLLKFLSMDFVSAYEVMCVSMMMGMVAYLLTGAFQMVEIGLMLMIISITLAFPGIALARHKTTVGKAALKWDYLICSYYHQNRPSLFWVSYFVNAFGYFFRLFGWRKSETKLYLTLAGQAALFSVMTLPLDIVKSLMLNSGANLITELWLSSAIGLVVTVTLIPVYLPPLVEPLAQYKLSGETTKLKYAGILGCACAFIGTLLGFLGVGMSSYL
jgi:ribosomal protein S27E